MNIASSTTAAINSLTDGGLAEVHTERRLTGGLREANAEHSKDLAGNAARGKHSHFVLR
jgi:hypothetical protein